MLDLCMVVPLYNERGSLPGFFDEWLPEFRAAGINFKILLIDAGSNDGSLELISEYQKENKEITVEVRPKLPYGPSCLLGYQMAIESGAEYMILIDSDGQCNPTYFKTFWQLRSPDKCVQGFREKREDGLNRLFVSRVLSMLVCFLSGRYILDLNVPYRLIHRDMLARVIALIPPDFELTNVLLSYLCDYLYGMKWVAIVFRERTAGSAKMNAQKIMKGAIAFIPAFAKAKAAAKNQ